MSDDPSWSSPFRRAPLDPDDRQRLDALLRRLGATDAEIERSSGRQTLGALALELAIRGGEPPLPLAQAAVRAGLDVDHASRLLRALGFPDPAVSGARVPFDLAEGLAVFSAFGTSMLGEEASMGLARLIGTSAARLAEAVVDAFRVQFEVPERQSGTRYSEVVEAFVELAHDGLPTLLAAIDAVVKAHLVLVAEGDWSLDEEASAAKRDLTVGFVDLVGYTALSRTLSVGELAAVVNRFEALVAECVVDHGGRVVKSLGDGALYVTEQPAAACEIALGLVDRFADDDVAPPARVGLALGEVLSLHGDYYGDVVNLSARLMALARPSTVVASDVLRDALREDERFHFHRLPHAAIKGFHTPPTTYRVRRTV